MVNKTTHNTNLSQTMSVIDWQVKDDFSHGSKKKNFSHAFQCTPMGTHSFTVQILCGNKRRNKELRDIF